MNPRNFGLVVGRLTRDPKVFPNKDGSNKIMMTVAVNDNFKSKGEYASQFVEVQAFVPQGNPLQAVYEKLKQGDLVNCQYSVRSNVFEKDGVRQYEQVLQIETIDTLLESKTEREARMLRKQNNDNLDATQPNEDELPA